MKEGLRFRRTPVPELTVRYLDLFARHGVRATFFVVGTIAREHPDLIAKIAGSGHEIACHGDRHEPLDRLGPDGFRRDLRANREALRRAGGGEPRGFRAPIASLTPATSWAHGILREEGFAYSSSVIPAKNPLYGWPGFGLEPRMVEGVLEIPITVARFGPLVLPFLSGTYCRVLPLWMIRRALDRHPAHLPLVGYFHPYDLDREQQWVMSDGLNGNPILNHLLYMGRTALLRRLDTLLVPSVRGITCSEFVATARLAYSDGSTTRRVEGGASSPRSDSAGEGSSECRGAGRSTGIARPA